MQLQTWPPQSMAFKKHLIQKEREGKMKLTWTQMPSAKDNSVKHLTFTGIHRRFPILITVAKCLRCHVPFTLSYGDHR